MTKRIQTILAASLASAGVLYAAATFDITQWSAEGRAALSFFWNWATVVSFVVTSKA